jgi:hypothetical protein
VKTWTAQTGPGAAPVLVREGFSLGAFLFGPLWLASHGAWLLAAVALAIDAVVAIWAPVWASVGLAFLFGLFGQDLRRYALELRGYTVVHVLAARDEDAALARLLAGRPDLLSDSLSREAVR